MLFLFSAMVVFPFKPKYRLMVVCWGLIVGVVCGRIGFKNFLRGGVVYVEC